MTHQFNLMTPHLRTNSHFSVLFLPVQQDDTLSKPNAEPMTESATAKRGLVRNLSAYVKVEKDNKGEYVGQEHPSRTTKAGGNYWR